MTELVSVISVVSKLLFCIPCLLVKLMMTIFVMLHILIRYEFDYLDVQQLVFDLMQSEKYSTIHV